MIPEDSWPLLREVDCLQTPVPDLDAGLRLPGTDTELVLQTERPELEVNLLVASADGAARVILEAGGGVVVPPFDLQVGRCAVLHDPWGNRLVVLNLSKGLLVTDEQGNVREDPP